MIRTSFTALALVTITGCMPVDPPETVSQANNCPVYGNRNWHAWIDKMPGPDAQMTLNISGEVDMPTPGYTPTLVEGPADRMMPPGLRFTLETSAPDGIVTQVITPTQVSYREPTPFGQIREVIILCGGEALVTIPDVGTTE